MLAVLSKGISELIQRNFGGLSAQPLPNRAIGSHDAQPGESVLLRRLGTNSCSAQPAQIEIAFLAQLGVQNKLQWLLNLRVNIARAF